MASGCHTMHGYHLQHRSLTTDAKQCPLINAEVQLQQCQSGTPTQTIPWISFWMTLLTAKHFLRKTGRGLLDHLSSLALNETLARRRRTVAAVRERQHLIFSERTGGTTSSSKQRLEGAHAHHTTHTFGDVLTSVWSQILGSPNRSVSTWRYATTYDTHSAYHRRTTLQPTVPQVLATCMETCSLQQAAPVMALVKVMKSHHWSQVLRHRGDEGEAATSAAMPPTQRRLSQ
jgi:hypothetical protein